MRDFAGSARFGLGWGYRWRGWMAGAHPLGAARSHFHNIGLTDFHFRNLSLL